MRSGTPGSAKPQAAAGLVLDPRKLVAHQHHRLAVDLDLSPAAAQVDQPALFEHSPQPRDVAGAKVVVAQHEKHAVSRLELSERVGNPIEARLRFDEIARQRYQIGLKLVAGADDLAEVRLAHAAGQVEVGKMNDRKPVERGGEPRHVEHPIGHVQPQDFIQRQPGEEVMRGFRGVEFRRSRIDFRLPLPVKTHQRRRWDKIPQPNQPQQRQRRDRPADDRIDGNETAQAASAGAGPPRRDREPLGAFHIQPGRDADRNHARNEEARRR